MGLKAEIWAWRWGGGKGEGEGGENLLVSKHRSSTLLGPLPKKLISGLKQLYWGSLVQGLIRGLAEIKVERADFKSIQSNKLPTAVYLNNLISC